MLRHRVRVGGFGGRRIAIPPSVDTDDSEPVDERTRVDSARIPNGPDEGVLRMTVADLRPAHDAAPAVWETHTLDAVADRVVRTHSATLWFVDDLVVKRKRPVDLGFLDFRSFAARRRACRRELDLNCRLGNEDVHLGLADVVDESGDIVDVALVMRRLPDDRRLATLAGSRHDLDDCVTHVARVIAAFHAGQPPAAHPRDYASPAVLRANWDDNLAVLRDHPELVDPARVDRVAADVDTWLAGREQLLEDRIVDGWVRDGHGDLIADDVFCTQDGPRILDCLDFADKYRIGDVLLDVAFLAMDLERLTRPDLAALLLSTHAELLGGSHPVGLMHHYVAYRASVRAKVACLVDDPSPTEVDRYLRVVERHLANARPLLVLVGGLPGTGKSTLAEGLAGRSGWSLLRTDEIRKDLLGTAHDHPAGPDGYTDRMIAATYAEMLDRARTLLQHGETVVCDASWSDPTHRRVAEQVAREGHAELRAIECRLPAELARRRLQARRGDASDADQDVHDDMRRRFAGWPQAMAVDTSPAPDDVLRTARAALGIPSPATPAQPPTTTEDAMDTRPVDRQGLEVLAPSDCLRLLDLSPVGRVGFVAAGEPVILPVNHLRRGRSVVFRTASGLTLDAASRGAAMAFEVDGYDEATRTGWSVLLRGMSDLEVDRDTIARLEQQDLHPWADGVDRPHWVRVRASELSGRRIPDVT